MALETAIIWLSTLELRRVAKKRAVRKFNLSSLRPARPQVSRARPSGRSLGLVVVSLGLIRRLQSSAL